MKNILIVIGILAILINSLIGIIFRDYKTFNWISADAVIIVNIILLLFLHHSKISDGFKVAMNFILPFLGLIIFGLTIKLENKLEDNYLLSSILILFSVQIILFVLINAIKKLNNDKSSMS